jgi:hypothetical protein
MSCRQLTFPMPSNVLHPHVQRCSIASQRHDLFPQPSADDSYNPLPNPLLSPLTHALLATEAAFLYRFSALRPSGSVLVHPNVLVSLGHEPHSSMYVASSPVINLIPLPVVFGWLSFMF